MPILKGTNANGPLSGLRSVARCEVAVLEVKLGPEVEFVIPRVDDWVHNISAKKVLSVTEFKQMFYARGDNTFCLSNIYDCPDNTNSILASVWGKRVDDNPCNPCSRVMNFNRLGGRPDCPLGVDMAYGYDSDIQRTFFAQFEIIGNLERDLCVRREQWSKVSRMKIEDQLYSLALVPERDRDLCAHVVHGRTWSEVEDCLVESCLAEGQLIEKCEHVDLYIILVVQPNNPEAKPTKIRIRYTVQMKRKPDDLGDWNVRARDTASGVISTGIKHDAPEGGKFQPKNSSNINQFLPPAAYPNSPYPAHVSNVSLGPPGFAFPAPNTYPGLPPNVAPPCNNNFPPYFTPPKN